MQTPIDSFLIIGDKYSMSAPVAVADDEYQELGIIEKVTPSTWHEYFFDNIFYIQNQLLSHFEFGLESVATSFGDALRLFTYKDLMVNKLESSSGHSSKCSVFEPECLSEVTNLIDIQSRDGIFSDKKDTTLVIEWTGINDVLSLNAHCGARDAVAITNSRITNIERLIRLGYKNFVLFNVPLLSVLPVTNFISADIRERKHQVSEAINQNLDILCISLRRTHPDCNIEIFNISGAFQACDEALSTSLTSKPFFYADCFYEGMPLSLTANKFIADKFFNDFFRLKYIFHPPQNILEEQFKSAYKRKWDVSKSRIGIFASSKINHIEADLDEIFKHALLGDGSRTLSVLIELNWLNKDRTLRSKHPSIVKAYSKANMPEEETNALVT